MTCNVLRNNREQHVSHCVVSVGEGISMVVFVVVRVCMIGDVIRDFVLSERACH